MMQGLVVNSFVRDALTNRKQSPPSSSSTPVESAVANWLCGFRDPDNDIILANIKCLVSFENAKLESINNEIKDLEGCLPGGVEVLGVHLSLSSSNVTNEIARNVKSLTYIVTSPFEILNIATNKVINEPEIRAYHYYPHVFSFTNVFNRLPFRFQTQICIHENDSISSIIETQCKSLLLQQTFPSPTQIELRTVLLSAPFNDINPTLSELFITQPTTRPNTIPINKHVKVFIEKRPLPTSPECSAATQQYVSIKDVLTGDDEMGVAPYVIYEDGTNRKSKIIELDVLLYVSINERISDFITLFKSTVSTKLERAIHDITPTTTSISFIKPIPFLFTIPSSLFTTFATRFTHERDIDTDIFIPTSDPTTSLLTNLHHHLPTTPNNNPTTLHLHPHKNLYHHYGHSDKGWGCAYRSCQTLLSHFISRATTSHPTPSIDQIQSILVQLGDKSSKDFIGSKEWIGSVEVGLVLQYYIEQIPTKTSYFVKQWFLPSFESSLSESLPPILSDMTTLWSANKLGPVMIGGGVLAYTILGIDWDKTKPYKESPLEHCWLLILDPHYVGPNDVATVIKSKFCAWKRPEQVFVKGHHYGFAGVVCG